MQETNRKTLEKLLRSLRLFAATKLADTSASSAAKRRKRRKSSWVTEWVCCDARCKKLGVRHFKDFCALCAFSRLPNLRTLQPRRPQRGANDAKVPGSPSGCAAMLDARNKS